MIYVYCQQHFKPELITDHLPADTVWIDLLNPTDDEEKFVEKEIGIDIPTRKEMQEIEVSSRLYKENGGVFMTVTMIAKSDSPEPRSDAVTLILTNGKLITVRYIEPQSFALFISRSRKLPVEQINSLNLFIELLDSSVDRLADILENISHRLENYSQIIFRPRVRKSQRQANFKKYLQEIGASGDLGTKAQESLINFNRLITFFEQTGNTNLDNENKSRLNTIRKDIQSLSDYSTFLFNKVTFLLDATLGMINIEQNNIIKIFSIVAVILLPPTLVASIYGMNFHHMPELQWQFGYPISIGLMLISAYIPYKFFKKKNWL